ncbi:MauE/DoxX family redox-associated membrane protein [Allomuricauda sp. NBRC 101325]|uniref:DoxX family protein n=1 Tax=Allomuricauda sp. NBRC 101325 TaxID=1113758 RepID=UPI0024A17738|nr:MauE/DoxX family redox-associated membrane protein [Muricauda sp. NBRC 101325]GLU45631.1 membrane protein [Muricauda sp. NBRC 101325]
MGPWHLYLMALLYIFAGIMHFIKPKMYMRIMPQYLPSHKLLVVLSGIFEVAFGVALLIPFAREWAVYGIILMLLSFLPVHFYMLSSEKASAGIPLWLLILRVPLQFVLMYWAFSYVNI